jgi:hypothetical protein
MISAYRSGETLIVFSPAVSAVRKASMREKGSQPPGEQKRTRTGGEPQPRRHTALLDTRHHSDTTLTAKTWTLSLGARPSAGPHEWQGQGSAVPIVFHPDNSHHSGIYANSGVYATVLAKVGGLELHNSARDGTRIHREAGFGLPSARKWSSLPSPLFGKVGRW